MSRPEFVGFWEIIDCTPNSALARQQGILNSIFELTKAGEVRWNVPENTIEIPLLKCDTYEIVSRGHHANNALLRLGTYRGHILEFHMDTFQGNPGLFTMSRGWCLMQCRRVGPPPKGPVPPSYSLLPALDEGYFSDLNISAANKKVFKVHLCILKMIAPDLDWTSAPPPLSGLPEEVLGTTLHYLYAQCLPSSLLPATAENVLTLLAGVPALHGLRQLCTTYLSHLTFKSQIVTILKEIYTISTRMTERFSRKVLRYDPEELCETIKQAARDAAVGFAKMILLSDIYNKKKDELSEEAGNEVLRFIQSRAPYLLGQIKSFLLAVSSALSGLQAPQRQDLASYLASELANMLDMLISILSKARHVVDNLLKQGLKLEYEESRRDLPNLETNLNNVLHKKEMIRLSCFLQRITTFQRQLMRRKEGFEIMSRANQIRSLTRTLEQAIEELPVFLLRLEEVTGVLDHKFEWNESQFCIKVGTAKVCEILKKLVMEKYIVKEIMVELCQLVDHKSFSESVVALGLLDPADVPASDTVDPKTDGKASKDCSCKLNLMDSLSKSPCAQNNPLSDAAAALLKSQVETDVVFEVLEDGGNVVNFNAHRVIVAARCDWFRRALLSGMQEDIHRRIQVHETNPQVFSIFLKYLYSGRLGSSPTGEQLAELLLLSDRYEVDDLKTACEEALKTYLNGDSLFDLLQLADQFNALSLKQSCAELIKDEPSLLCQDVCRDLPTKLVKEIHSWTKHASPRNRFFRRDAKVHSLLSLSGRVPGNHSSRSDEMNEAVVRLRNVVGDAFSRSHLENILLAADLDLNRALDLFYFTSS